MKSFISNCLPAKRSASLIRGGAAKIMSWSTGSLKQLVLLSSNFLHLESVLFAKDNATGFDTLGIPFLEAKVPRVACQINPKDMQLII